MHDELARACDENLVVTWGRLGTLAGFATECLTPVTLTSSGLQIAYFNGAFVRPRVADADQVITQARAFFSSKTVPWLLWVRQGADDALSDACRGQGLADVGGPDGMVLPSIPPVPPQSCPSGLTVDVASNHGDLAANRALIAAGFGMPPEVTERVITPELLRATDLAVLIGRVRGQPVSCSLVSVTGHVAGIYNVATPLHLRGRGYGEALTWAALLEGRRRGATAGILQASADGKAIYARMGFQECGRYEQWLFPPSDGDRP